MAARNTQGKVGAWKRIIVCCDGTWMNSDNGFVRNSPFPCDSRGSLQVPSNVTRICRCIKKESSDGIQQIVYYQSGVGSTNDIGSRILGGATGLGLAENIREAYCFICANWEAGDEIYLLGFSRGAFTARSISALVSTIGVLTKDGLKYFYQIYQDWENQNAKNWKSPWPDHPWPSRPNCQTPEYKQKLNEIGLSVVDVPVKAVAIWDTVGALGIPMIGFLPQPLSRHYSFINSIPAPNVEYAFQALALDEHRRQFSPTLWERPDDSTMPKILKQVWFPGVHSDIGGGYKSHEISDMTLAWMISQLDPFIDFEKSFALQGDAETQTYQGSEAPQRSWGMGTIHNSHKGILRLGGKKTRTPGNYLQIDRETLKSTDRRLRNTNEALHASVRVRLALNGPGYNDKGVWQPKGLEGFTIDGVDVDGDGMVDGLDQVRLGQSHIRWLWRRTPDADPEITLSEDPLGDVELDLLKQSPDVYAKLMRIAPAEEHVSGKVTPRNRRDSKISSSRNCGGGGGGGGV